MEGILSQDDEYLVAPMLRRVKRTRMEFAPEPKKRPGSVKLQHRRNEPTIEKLARRAKTGQMVVIESGGEAAKASVGCMFTTPGRGFVDSVYLSSFRRM